MLVTMVPVVDQIADVRDVAANLYILSKPERRTDGWVWMALVLTLIGLVPVFGSAAKGVLRLVMNSLRPGGSITRAQIFQVIRRLGRGDPARFVAEHLSAAAMQREADRWLRWVLPKVQSFFRKVEEARLVPQRLREGARRALTDLDAVAREAPRQMRDAISKLDEALRRAMGQGSSNTTARGTVNRSPARAMAREADPPPAERPAGPERRRGDLEPPAADSVEKARSWQGSGDYPGIDAWVKIRLRPGQIIYAGEPGVSGFFVDPADVHRAGGDAAALFQRLQVKPHDALGYRPRVVGYEVISETDVASSRALANPQFGVGGAKQYFVSDWQGSLRRRDDLTIPLHNTNPKP
jgi:hypothetical protein